LNSSVPYFIRALNEWILDNNCTPYLVVDATMDGVDVPRDFVNDGQIVLNISPNAVRELEVGTDWVLFRGRFKGVAYNISVPIKAVLGVVAKENGEGMWFPRSKDRDPEPPNEPVSPLGPPSSSSDGKPSLRVIK